MEDLMTKLYCYDCEPENVKSESDDKVHKHININTIIESGSDIFDQKTRNRKIQIFYNSDESKEEKSDVEEKEKDTASESFATKT